MPLLYPGRAGAGNQHMPLSRNCFALTDSAFSRATAEYSSGVNCLMQVYNTNIPGRTDLVVRLRSSNLFYVISKKLEDTSNLK